MHIAISTVLHNLDFREKRMMTDVAIPAIRGFYRDHKRLPTYSEMCTLLGYASKRSIYQIVGKLVEQGVLEKDVNGRLIPKNLGFSLPVLGTIQAGYPASASQQYFGNLQMEEYFVSKPTKSYMLRVQGDSMIDAGIQPGDYVVVEECERPRDGDIVAAEVDGAVTLKYFKTVPKGFALVPANKNYPEFSPRESLKIYGKVVSVMRKYS